MLQLTCLFHSHTSHVMIKNCRVEIGLGLIITVNGRARAGLGQNVDGLGPGSDRTWTSSGRVGLIFLGLF